MIIFYKFFYELTFFINVCVRCISSETIFSKKTKMKTSISSVNFFKKFLKIKIFEFCQKNRGVKFMKFYR